GRGRGIIVGLAPALDIRPLAGRNSPGFRSLVPPDFRRPSRKPAVVDCGGYMSLTRALQGLLVVTTLAACAKKEEEAPPPPEPMSQAGATALRGAFVNLYMTKNSAGAADFYADDA